MSYLLASEAMSDTPPDVGSAVSVRWFLESLVDSGRQLRRLPIHPLPFKIGRRPGLGLTLPSESVSKEHAEIYQLGEDLRLRDLHSTNGTFLNRDRVTDAPIRQGDIIHFADFEFRLGQQRVEEVIGGEDSGPEPSTVSLGDQPLPNLFVRGTRELEELLRDGLVAPVFQPIVSLPEGSVAGYEVLGRGRHPHLPDDPAELFRIAASMGMEAQLSRLFRKNAIETLAPRTDLPHLFLNTHPSELSQPGLLESLRDMQALAPQLRLILEIHESALADTAGIAGLLKELTGLGIGLAYDDFGAGQARLLELAEVPPHYLKFDKRFVHGIDQAPPSKRRLLTSLVTLSRDLLVQTVAEGIETAEEVEVCSRVGFTHAQGYHFGKPVALEQI
jgi:EAL domain-containing protein (putative c-di-GMP-specific phosphodiesterase class I)